MSSSRTPEVRRPKVKCCVSSSRCGRCPIRLLKEGALPDGYDVKKRRLVRDPAFSGEVKAKITKAELDTAVKRTRKRQKKSGGKKKLAA